MNFFKVEIVPVFDDGPPYYKTIVYDLVVRDNVVAESTPRDIFHCDTIAQSIDMLNSAIRL